MTITVKVEGLKEVQAALRELSDATAKNVMRRVLKARAETVAEAARAGVPVDQGNLQASINVSNRLTRRQRGRHRKVDRDDVEMFVGPGSNPAAHMQEFGTSHHPAQPFMRPAWDRTKDALLEGVRADMWAESRRPWSAAPSARPRLRGADLEEGLITKLLATSSVAALAGTRIYPGRRPQGSPLPAITLARISGAPVYTDQGEAGLATARLEIDCWAESYGAAKQTARAVVAALSAFAGTAGGIRFQTILLDAERDFSESGSNAAQYLYRTNLDLIVWWET